MLALFGWCSEEDTLNVLEFWRLSTGRVFTRFPKGLSNTFWELFPPHSKATHQLGLTSFPGFNYFYVGNVAFEACVVCSEEAANPVVRILRARCCSLYLDVVPVSSCLSFFFFSAPT